MDWSQIDNEVFVYFFYFWFYVLVGFGVFSLLIKGLRRVFRSFKQGKTNKIT